MLVSDIAMISTSRDFICSRYNLSSKQSSVELIPFGFCSSNLMDVDSLKVIGCPNSLVDDVGCDS